MHLVLFRTLRAMPLLISFSPYTSVITARKLQYSVCILYSNIVTTIGKGNGSFLVLLDLSAAFDTIDHSNLFVILEKYVEITGDALRYIKSYFSDPSQTTCIESIVSNIVHPICGVPQGSALGPLKFCLQLLSLVAIFRYHSIGYLRVTTHNCIFLLIVTILRQLYLSLIIAFLILECG